MERSLRKWLRRLLLQVRRSLSETRYISYELTRAGGGDAFSSYTIRPGTTPLTRTGVSARLFRAYVPMSGGSLQAPE